MLFLLIATLLVTDDAGRVRDVDSWRGAPVILAPMYCRCPLACPMIARGLKRGIAESNTSPSTYRVVMFSMDKRDTPEDLRRFRERHQLPLSWTVVSSSDPHAFLDPLGYHYADANGLFVHPNQIIVLDANHKPVKSLFGTTYPGAQIDEALAIARGRTDWIGKYGGIMIAALLFIALMAAVYVVASLTKPPRPLLQK